MGKTTTSFLGRSPTGVGLRKWMRTFEQHEGSLFEQRGRQMRSTTRTDEYETMAPPTENEAMNERDEWVEKAKTKLDEWNEELDELEAKARVAKAEQKARYQRVLASLREYRDRLRNRISEVEEAGDTAWDELKEGAERGWRSLQEGFRAAAEEFKKETGEPPKTPPAPPA